MIPPELLGFDLEDSTTVNYSENLLKDGFLHIDLTLSKNDVCIGGVEAYRMNVENYKNLNAALWDLDAETEEGSEILHALIDKDTCMTIFNAPSTEDVEMGQFIPESVRNL